MSAEVNVFDELWGRLSPGQQDKILADPGQVLTGGLAAAALRAGLPVLGAYWPSLTYTPEWVLGSDFVEWLTEQKQA